MLITDSALQFQCIVPIGEKKNFLECFSCNHIFNVTNLHLCANQGVFISL